MLGVLYVRLRIADTHGREMARAPVFWSHMAVLLAVVVAAFLEVLPWLVTVPYAGYLARAVWAVYRTRPVVNIVRFGFSEIGAEIAGGILVVLGYLSI